MIVSNSRPDIQNGLLKRGLWMGVRHVYESVKTKCVNDEIELIAGEIESRAERPSMSQEFFRIVVKKLAVAVIGKDGVLLQECRVEKHLTVERSVAVGADIRPARQQR